MDERAELLDSAYIALDPVLDGFEGVLVELCRMDEHYILTATAVGGGNRLMRFSSVDPRRVRKMFRNRIEGDATLLALVNVN